MITAGIDIGIENIKILILKDDTVLNRGCVRSGAVNRAKNASDLFRRLLDSLGTSANDVDKIVVTGIGSDDIKFADYSVTEPIADAYAARFLCPSSTDIIDIGADQTRLVNLDDNGGIKGVVVNQKCSAGIGTFMRVLARDLDTDISHISGLSIEDADSIAANTGCCVFAELDVLERLFDGVPTDEIAADAVKAAAVRVNSILKEKIPPDPKTALITGGVARNKAFVSALELRSGMKFLETPEPEYSCALGAAVIAAQNPYNY